MSAITAIILLNGLRKETIKMETINNKVADWQELRKIVDRVRDTRGEQQHKAYREFIDKSKDYVNKYQERFNAFQKPMIQ